MTLQVEYFFLNEIATEFDVEMFIWKNQAFYNNLNLFSLSKETTVKLSHTKNLISFH